MQGKMLDVVWDRKVSQGDGKETSPVMSSFPVSYTLLPLQMEQLNTTLGLHCADHCLTCYLNICFHAEKEV